MKWDNRKSIKTIKLYPNTNVATTTLAPGFQELHSYCAKMSTKSDQEYIQEGKEHPQKIQPTLWELETEMDTQKEVQTIQEDINNMDMNSEQEFLNIHVRLGHISPKRIQKMAKLGIIPAKLQRCRVPICTSCMYGKATKKQW